MKKAAAILLILLLPTPMFSQFITTSTSQTVPLMVQNVLLSNNGIPSCGGTIFNVTWQAGPSASSTNGIGTFTNTNPNFPMTSGMILSTGNVSDAPGPNTTTQGFGSNAWAGDGQLLTYMQSLGFNVTTYRNAAILEFDFVPLTNIMNFDFVFASEEYGVFQCEYSDAFAFFLNNVTTGTPVENLALIPATTIPISVTSIRDAQFNLGTGTCLSANVDFFGAFYGNGNGANAPINFNGRTVKMQANKVVVAGQRYHIKFVIADRKDNDYDSAVFLGNFTTGEFISGTGQYAGLGDLSAAANLAICNAPITVQAGPTAVPNATYTWTLNSSPTPIVGANLHTYTATQAGTYSVLMTLPNGCQLTDSIVIDYLPPIQANPAGNLTACTGRTFDLNSKKPTILGTLPAWSHPIKFYTRLQDAEASLQALTNSQSSFFPGTEGQQIWARLVDESTGSNCFVIQSFFLNFTPRTTPAFDQAGPFCVGDNIVLPTISNNVPPISGTWALTTNNVTTRVYTFTPNTVLFPCATSVDMTVVINNTPIAPQFNNVGPYCAGTAIQALPTTSLNGISGTWTPALDNAQTTIYTFKPNVGSCALDARLEIIIKPLIITSFTQVAPICSGATLLPLPTTSDNGILGNWSPQINSSATTTYTFTPTPGQCASTKKMTIIVNTIPTVTVEIQNICAGLSAKVEARPVPAGNYTYEWTVPAGVTNPGNAQEFQTTTAGNNSVIITSVAGCRSASASGNLTITPIATFQVRSSPVCEGTPAKVEAVTLVGVPADYSYVWTVPTGVTNPGNIDIFNTNVVGNYRVIATSIATNCQSPPASVAVQINPKPVVSLPQNGYICVDSSGATIAGSGSSFALNTGLSAALYSFEWFTNSTSNGVTTPSFTAVTPGTYKVIVTNLTTLCSATASATIVPSLPPTSITLTASNYFENNQTISVAVLPAGVYEYQLDGGFYQDGNEFTNVDSGIHEVRVRDKKACGSVGDSILTVDYPHFFTPNGDGFNDKWNVNELKNPSVATIVYVYDRYGKLLKQLAVNGEGWDGTYNGSPMLSDDYWFKILYTEKGIAKEFKAHFSLKR